jgi:SPP1 family predicted phage head-tail adaptor
MINSGELDTRIQFEVKQQTGRDTVGAPIYSWVIFARVWAKRKDLRGKETLLAGAHTAVYQTEYLIRYMVGLHEDMRINDGGVYYDIQNISRVGRKEGLLVLAKVPGGDV